LDRKGVKRRPEERLSPDHEKGKAPASDFEK